MTIYYLKDLCVYGAEHSLRYFRFDIALPLTECCLVARVGV